MSFRISKPMDQNEAPESGEQVICYYCEKTGTIITVGEVETVLVTQGVPDELLQIFSKAELMSQSKARDQYKAAKLRKAH